MCWSVSNRTPSHQGELLLNQPPLLLRPSNNVCPNHSQRTLRLRKQPRGTRRDTQPLVQETAKYPVLRLGQRTASQSHLQSDRQSPPSHPNANRATRQSATRQNSAR